MDNLSITQNLTPRSKWQEFIAGWPIVQFVIAGVFGLVTIYTTVQLTQSNQAAAIKTNTDRIEKLEKESVPKELFDERTLRILEEQRKLGDRFDKFLERKNVANN